MRIVHPTDLTGDDELAFVHAAGLAAISGARLITVYAGNDLRATGPDATALAGRWGRPIDHEFRRVECCDDVAETLVGTLRALDPTLIVVGTHARHGLSALLHGSVGEAIARNVDRPVLVVPNRSRGFVDDNGRIELRRVLIPANDTATALRGTDAARSLLAMVDSDAMIELLHVGPLDRELEALGATRVDGDLEDAIVGTVRQRDACIVVMPTHGHDGVGDVLRGSHTERVIRDIRCPVLSVPI